MINIAICDDEDIFLTQISTLTEQILNKAFIPFKTHLFLSGEELIQSLENGSVYDIAFLDIQMNKISGIDVGALLRQQFRNTKTLLIYISAYESRAKEVFYYNAIRFLSKPIDPLLFEESLYYACQIVHEQRDQNFTFKELIKGQVTLPLSEIIYFEITEAHKINVITFSTQYYYWGKMSDVSSKFSETGFLRIHQAYLINFDYIKEINFDEVLMSNNVFLPVSRARRKEVRAQYLKLRQRREFNWL